MDIRDPIEELAETAGRKARILFERGEKEAARTALLKVIEDHPSHPAGLEAKADLLRLEGKLAEAASLYAEVIEKHPGRVNTERKHAEIVLSMHEKELVASEAFRATNVREVMNPAGVRRTSGMSAFLSLLSPGFGQVYNGYLVKGLVMLAITAVLWVLMFTVGYVSAAEGRGTMTTVGWAILVLGLAYYVAAVMDAAVSAQKNTPPPAPARPKPPVDKPFE
ncbi:MAG: tetratricopeptide repeat protein [Armatimonadetes bacterium]|nr:tetratricopeptide repeat protein [Armatimonadota bacterium]